jgi:high-affinity Fe2+/Pb2+ permease
VSDSELTTQKGRRDPALWFGTTGSAVAWAVHLAITYPLVEVSCASGGRLFLYAASVVLGLVIVASWWVSWQRWRRMTPEERGSLVNSMEGTREGFMAYVGLLAGGLFMLGIILATLPMLFIDPCARFLLMTGAGH